MGLNPNEHLQLGIWYSCKLASIQLFPLFGFPSLSNKFTLGNVLSHFSNVLNFLLLYWLHDKYIFHAHHCEGRSTWCCGLVYVVIVLIITFEFAIVSQSINTQTSFLIATRFIVLHITTNNVVCWVLSSFKILYLAHDQNLFMWCYGLTLKHICKYVMKNMLQN